MNDWLVLKRVPTWSEFIEDIVNYFDEDGQLVISRKSKGLTNLAGCDIVFLPTDSSDEKNRDQQSPK